MFNCYVVLAGRDMVIDASRSSTCRRKIKAPSLQTKVTKNEGPSENMIFSKNPFEDFNEKKQYKVLAFQQTTPWSTRPMKTTTEYGPCKHKKQTKQNLKKSNQVKSVVSLQYEN